MKFVISESEKKEIRSLYEQLSPLTYALSGANLTKLDNKTKDTINQTLQNYPKLKLELDKKTGNNTPDDILSYLVSKGIEPYVQIRGNEALGEKVVRTGIYFNLGNTPFGINLNLGDNPMNVLGRLDNTRLGLKLPF
jgi:hypothetical protein